MPEKYFLTVPVEAENYKGQHIIIAAVVVTLTDEATGQFKPDHDMLFWLDETIDINGKPVTVPLKYANRVARQFTKELKEGKHG